VRFWIKRHGLQTLAARGLSVSVARLRAEAAKWALVCSNCHAEVEAGMVDIPG
jgi:hypothetical protein